MPARLVAPYNSAMRRKQIRRFAKWIVFGTSILALSLVVPSSWCLAWLRSDGSNGAGIGNGAVSFDWRSGPINDQKPGVSLRRIGDSWYAWKQFARLPRYGSRPGLACIACPVWLPFLASAM